MSEPQKIIGACVRAIREQQGLSQQNLATRAGISYQYLSGVEAGKENFTIQVVDGLARALGMPLQAFIAAAYGGAAGAAAPTLDRSYFRHQTPLPNQLTVAHIEAAANLTQSIIHRMNRNMTIEVGLPLQGLIQGNNFSGLVSNIFTNSIDQCSPYKHNHDQRYPDLICPGANNGQGEGLEVKTTINIGKGGESHNGHSGWHVIACYNFLPNGDIVFVHIMFASLKSHQDQHPDWSYVGSKVNADTGSRRTETYTTNLRGTTKLRDGSVYLNPGYVNYQRWKQERLGAMPPWSIFASQL